MTNDEIESKLKEEIETKKISFSKTSDGEYNLKNANDILDLDVRLLQHRETKKWIKGLIETLTDMKLSSSSGDYFKGIRETQVFLLKQIGVRK